MSKLFKLKEWLTLDEAAKYIAASIGEEVFEKDILRLVLDKHLTLSVDLVNHAYGIKAKVVGPDEVQIGGLPKNWLSGVLQEAAKKHEDDPEFSYEDFLSTISLGDGLFLNKENNLQSISGVWDLPLWGNEKLDVLHKYQQLINGPEVTLICLEGTYVRRGNIAYELQHDFDDNEYQKGSKAYGEELEKLILVNDIDTAKAKEIRDKYDLDRKEYLEQRESQAYRDNFYPAGALPDDMIYVIRTEEILRFLSSLDESQSEEKPLATRERNTLLVLIATLCKEANIDYEARGIAGAIEKMTELQGTKISNNKIREILQLLPEAVESRQN